MARGDERAGAQGRAELTAGASEAALAPDPAALERGVADAGALLRRVRHEVESVLIGQGALVERMLLALLCDGHVLIEGVPGLGKSLAVAALGHALDLEFRRIQFTPDLLPADVLGTVVFRPGSGEFSVRKGPIFAELLLADEINRAPPKVQSALLEAMQERQVTIGEQSHPLPRPFLVLATQNPIEHEGTYPLPEAELDRFLFKVRLDYPARADEEEILRRHGRAVPPRASETVRKVATREQLFAARRWLDEVYADPKVLDYVLRLVEATRAPEKAGASKLAGAVRLGASTRAAIALLVAAKGRALLEGRAYVTPGDVKELAPDVLRHRLLLGFEVEAAGSTPEQVLAELLRTVALP
jgi:MoxR-like ATPase